MSKVTDAEWIRDVVGGCQLRLHIQPGAKKNNIVGLFGEDRVKIQIRAPADDGKANSELISYLSDAIDIRKKDIHILRGEKSRDKDLLITSNPISDLISKIMKHFP